MTGPWKSDDHSDRFSDAMLALVAKKVEAGEAATVAAIEAAPPAGAENVIDPTELLAKSLARRKPAVPAPKPFARNTAGAAKKAAAKTSTGRRA